jgi:hypothetical protein
MGDAEMRASRNDHAGLIALALATGCIYGDERRRRQNAKFYASELLEYQKSLLRLLVSYVRSEQNERLEYHLHFTELLTS